MYEQLEWREQMSAGAGEGGAGGFTPEQMEEMMRQMQGEQDDELEGRKHDEL